MARPYEKDDNYGAIALAAKKNKCSTSSLQYYFQFGRNPNRRKREYQIKFQGDSKNG